MRRVPLLFVALGMVAGCPKPHERDQKPIVRPPIAPYVTDGATGVRILQGGARLRWFSTDRYQTSGEEKIIPRETPFLPASATGFGNWTYPDARTVRGEAPGDRVLTVRVVGGRVIAQMTQPNAKPNYVAVPEFAENPFDAARAAYHEVDAELRNAPRITVDSDDPRDQARIDMVMRHIATASAPLDSRAPAPMGLSSDVYHGHVFWDADAWIFPAQALLWPEAARATPRYRLRLLPQAKRNYADWIKAGRPTGKNPVIGPVSPGGGAKYPWESSVSGRETTPTSSRFQDHITGTVAFWLRRAAWLGLADEDAVGKVILASGVFYQSRSVKTTEGKRSIRGTMSPDEHHIGDDDLYTNLLADWSVKGGRFVSESDYVLPRDARSFLTYANDAERGYKQAAAVLAIYPLQYPPAERPAMARAMMARFEKKVTRNGPAMTDGVHATIWARLGEPDRAVETWRKSVDDFTRDGLYSEKRSSDRTVFLTGAAGSLNTVLYGFAGLRLDDRPVPDGLKLKSGGFLTVTPHLPTSWRSLTISPLMILGKRYDLRIVRGKPARLVPRL